MNEIFNCIDAMPLWQFLILCFGIFLSGTVFFVLVHGFYMKYLRRDKDEG